MYLYVRNKARIICIFKDCFMLIFINLAMLWCVYLMDGAAIEAAIGEAASGDTLKKVAHLR